MSLEALGLLGLLILVLVLPFSVRHVEEELEGFLLAMGAAAVTLSGQWSLALLRSAALEPLPLCAVVLGAGLVFGLLRSRLHALAPRAWERWGGGPSAVVLVAGLGLLSGWISAVVAALVLAELLSALRLARALEIRLAVLACFAIGFGSALTPLGGPLAAIAVSRLRAEPYHAGFFFLAQGLLLPILGLTLVLALLAWAWARGSAHGEAEPLEQGPGTLADLGRRCARIYAFVLGLVFLGQGFAPMAERWLQPLPSWALYWANLSSALLDNATLVAAEVGPGVPPLKLHWLMMGLLIGGGLLVPGNVPNIICAAQRRIRPVEWARVGVPLGLALMLAYQAAGALAGF